MGRRVAGLVGAGVLAALLLLVGCSTRGAVDDALERSSAPVLVPVGQWQEAFEFTAPPGSTDLFQLRWNFSAGATNFVSAWQVAQSAEYDQTAFAEGPSQDLVDEILASARGEACEPVQSGSAVSICLFDEPNTRGGVNAYLTRPVEGQVLVVEYLNLEEPASERSTYNPDSLGADFISAEFDPMTIEEARNDFLVYIY